MRSLLLAFLLFSTTCFSQVRYQDKIFTDAKVQKTTPKYATAIDENSHPIDLYADVYQPMQSFDTAQHRGCIILMSGGGFHNSNKSSSDMVTRAKEWFARRGWVAVVINYRTTSIVRDSTAPEKQAEVVVTDCQAAIRFMRLNRVAYHIDPNRIGVFGRSAGGISALMVGISNELADTMQLACPSMLEPPDTCWANQRSWVMSCFSESGLIYDDFRTAHLDSSDCPTFQDLHGDDDAVVPYSIAVSTKNGVQAYGLTFTLVTYPGLGHLGTPGGFIDAESESVNDFFNNIITTEHFPLGVIPISW